jgi:hypothetical protein
LGASITSASEVTNRDADFTVIGTDTRIRIGGIVSGGADVDGDGHPDLLIGSIYVGETMTYVLLASQLLGGGDISVTDAAIQIDGTGLEYLHGFGGMHTRADVHPYVRMWAADTGQNGGVCTLPLAPPGGTFGLDDCEQYAAEPGMRTWAYPEGGDFEGDGTPDDLVISGLAGENSSAVSTAYLYLGQL